MPFMKTESVEAGERKPTETAHGGIKIGLANGRYEFSPDFDKKFDDMDAEVAELFDVVNEKKTS